MTTALLAVAVIVSLAAVVGLGLIVFSRCTTPAAQDPEREAQALRLELRELAHAARVEMIRTVVAAREQQRSSSR